MPTIECFELHPVLSLVVGQVDRLQLTLRACTSDSARAEARPRGMRRALDDGPGNYGSGDRRTSPTSQTKQPAWQRQWGGAVANDSESVRLKYANSQLRPPTALMDYSTGLRPDVPVKSASHTTHKRSKPRSKHLAPGTDSVLPSGIGGA